MSFPVTGKVWMNGSLVDWKDATIHVASHVVHYGSGVFEGARCYSTPRGSACFRLDAHLRRLFDSAKIYRMEPKVSYDELHGAVLETIRANEFKACYIRPLIYRGYHTLGVNPFPCPVDAAILTWDWGAYLGQDALTNGVDVCISSWSRAAANTFPTLAKSTANYANSQLIKMEAMAEGYAEGIALDTAGYLSEGSGQNLFIVRDNTIYTPPLTASILPGITRASVITLASDLGLPVREDMLPREMLYIADEAFFAGTAVEITPIRSVDKIAIGNGRRGPLTEAIQQAFFDLVNGETPDRHGWLEFVYPGEPRSQVAAGVPAASAKK
jgi:branched-chain amino acid aminotransferase